MLQNNTLEATIGLATKLADRGITVSAIGGTPVAALVAAAHMPLPAVGDLAVMDDPAALLLKGSTLLNQQGVSEHDLVMDECVAVITQTVNTNLDLARNVVVPMVRATLEATETQLANIEQTRGHRWAVVPDFWAGIWSSPVLADMVGRYEESPVQQLRLDLIVPAPMGDTTLMELAQTGASRFDAEVAEFWATLPAGYAEDVYQQLFTETGMAYQSDLIKHLNPLTTDRRKVLLVHLWSRKLGVAVPDGVNRDLASYREYMSVIANQSGRAVARLLKRREFDRKSKLLIQPGGYDPIKGQVITNGDVYNDWLEAGGSPEILFGALCTDQETGYQTLLTRKEQYVKAWITQERVLATSLRLARHTHTVEALRAAMIAQIASLDAGLRVVEGREYTKRMHARLSALDSNFTDDLYGTVRKLVCYVLFPHTDALRVLEAIDRAAAANPGIDIREAGYLALIELVAGWVGQLLQVESVTA